MIESMLKASRSDSRLAGLLEEAREYAQIYLLARQRHKGCEGTGELMTLKEEFRDAIGELAIYCSEKGHLLDFGPDDLDAAARSLYNVTIR